VKHITTGEGGAVLTDDPTIDEKVRRLRNHGMTKDPNKLENNDGPWYYEINEMGYNYRITDFQCALGSSQLKKLDRFIALRCEIAAKYDTVFSDIESIVTPAVLESVKHAYHLYLLQIEFEKLGIKKTAFFEQMKRVGINLQVHYIPIHLQPFYKNKYGFKQGDFPISESFYRNEVSLPIYPELSTDEVSFVVNNILEIISA
jgi:dTDP-4-amino-4,6-dideoxygalactose transaminase